MIDNLTIEKIKGACWVGDFMQEDGVKLHKRGVNYHALCMFHNDRHLGGFVVDGRRDRFTCFSCGAHGNSIDYLMKHRGMSFMEALRYAAATYDIYLADEEPKVKPKAKLKPHQAPPPLPMLTINFEMVKKLARTGDNTLCKWLRALPWDRGQKEWQETILLTYMVGHGREGHTVFWQIDEQCRVRTGKMMKYKPDGHRDKEAAHNFDWVHSVLLRKHRWSDEQYEMQTCLFGLHLLPAIPDGEPIHIVESEKTALICAIAYQSPTWMATGGMQFFDRKHLQPLIDAKRKIICHPDRDGIQAWKDKAKLIDYENLFIDTGYLNQWHEKDGKKADIADVVVRMMTEREQTVLERMVEHHPALKDFIDQLQLEPF